MTVAADAVLVFIENENRTRIEDDGSRPFHRREKQKNKNTENLRKELWAQLLEKHQNQLKERRPE